MFFNNVKAGSRVNFSLSSVICPDIENVLEKLTSRLGLVGQVVMLSDSGEMRNHYAVVQVGGIMSPLVIPVSKLELCNSSSEIEIIEEKRA